MAKQLTMSKNPLKEEVSNSSVAEIAKLIYLEKINLTEPFQSLFPMEATVLEAIVEDMKIHGFDKSKPVNVWKKDDGTLVLIDGYTRVQAAMKSGVTRIPVFENHFKTEADALEYAINVQKNRRNLSDATILKLVEKIDSPVVGSKKVLIAPHGANKEPGIRTSKITAEKLGISTRKTERARAVLKDKKLANLVLTGDLSINSAVGLIENSKKKERVDNISTGVENVFLLISESEHISSNIYRLGVLQTLESLRLCNFLDSTVHSRLRKRIEELTR